MSSSYCRPVALTHVIKSTAESRRNFLSLSELGMVLRNYYTPRADKVSLNNRDEDGKGILSDVTLFRCRRRPRIVRSKTTEILCSPQYAEVKRTLCFSYEREFGMPVA